jgi:TonB family protein
MRTKTDKRVKQATQGRHLLAGFLLLSLLLHAAILLTRQPATSDEYYLDIGSPLHVSIMTTRQAVGETGTQNIKIQQVKPKQAKTVKHEQKLKNVPQASRTTVEPATAWEENTSNSAKTIVRALPSPTASDTAQQGKNGKNPASYLLVDTTSTMDIATRISSTDQINQLKKQLYGQIKARFSYPMIARRMGWEGLVSLSLRIENDGSLNNVRVTQTSGHRVLDDNAQQTLESIGSINIAAINSFKPVSTNVEVLYRLTD